LIAQRQENRLVDRVRGWNSGISSKTLGGLISLLGDIDIELWSKVKAKATLERKTMREVIFGSLKQYIKPVETAAGSDKKKKAKKKD